MTNGPSRNLAWDELRCHDAAGTPYPHEWRLTRAVRLAGAFEALRAKLGAVPLTIHSGFRTPEHNKRVGGAPASQHVQGRALDIAPPPGWTVQRMAEVARTIPSIGGIGYYKTFLHIDVREVPRLVVWHGSRPSADLGDAE